MLVEYQPLRPSRRALKAGRQHGLHQRLAGLEILAADRQFALARQFVHGRNIDGQVRRAVGEGHAFHQRGVGIDHRRRDVLVILLHRFFERLHALVSGGRLDEGFGRGAPDRDQPIGAARLAEVANVLPQLFGEVELVLAFLHVRAVDLLDVVVIEDGLHRLDRSSAALSLCRADRARARRRCAPPRTCCLRKCPSR